VDLGTALTPDRISELFREYLPDDVEIVFQNAETHVADALRHPFVQAQVQLGIYDMNNIWDEFLGVAKAIVPLRRVVVCPQLIHNQVEGLDSELAEAYVRHLAAHEAHHFEHKHSATTSDLLAQAHREMDCNNLIAERYPELEQLRERVDQDSVVIQRVYQRIRALKKASVA